LTPAPHGTCSYAAAPAPVRSTRMEGTCPAAQALWLASQSTNAILVETLIDRGLGRVGNDRRARVTQEWKPAWAKRTKV
jgi:hypothetical protein